MATSSTRRDTLVRALRGARPDFTLTNARSFADLVIAAPGDVFKASPLTFVPRDGDPVASSHVQVGRSDKIEALDQIQQKIDEADLPEQVKSRLDAYVMGVRLAASQERLGEIAREATVRIAIVAGQASAAVAAGLAAEIARVEGRISTDTVVEVGQTSLLGNTVVETSVRVGQACADARDGVLLITGVDKRAVELDEVSLRRPPVVVLAGSREGLDGFFVAAPPAAAHEFGWPVSSGGSSELEESTAPVVGGVERARAVIEATGLPEAVKFELHTIVDSGRLAADLRDRGLLGASAALFSAVRHQGFAGEPGTGKTTAARAVTEALYNVGLVTSATAVEVRRADLVGKYEGHTAANVRDIVNIARGGVLIVDEPEELVARGTASDQDPFGKEAAAGLVAAMKGGELLVIFTGQRSGLERFFAEVPGAATGVGSVVYFPKVTASDVAAAVGRVAAGRGLSIDQPEHLNRVAEALAGAMYRGSMIRSGNYWAARNLVDDAWASTANRLRDADDLSALSDEELMRIGVDDLVASARKIAAHLGSGDQA